MTNQELSEFIKNYIEHDKTQSAIMLTAPWGTGKSYYIEHELVPFLKDNKNGKHECIVVSLYGLSSLFELSKALYMESRMSFISKGSEKVTTSIFAAKTILKGAASFFGIDLSKSQEEMQHLYESVDLSDKLIILEDLERSGIDILEILGYVNSLAEQDRVKVLLVANESELLRYKPTRADTKEQQEVLDAVDRITDNEFSNPTEKTTTYLCTKEKTVSDTILYEGDVVSAIKQIMSEYDKTYFECFSSDIGIKEISQYLQSCGITNLRTFIYACQKTNDIFERIKPNPETEDDYIKTIFYSIIAFSHRIKSGNKEKWDGGNVFSAGLSSKRYPLFRFCYDYIMSQTFDPDKVTGTEEELKKLRLYSRDKSFGDKDIQTLENWWISSEEEVNNAIESIVRRLEKVDDISFYSYGRIAVNMIRAKAVIGCDIDRAKTLLVKNLHNRGSEIDSDYLFLGAMIDEKDSQILSEFNQLKEEMTESLAARETTICGFDYNPSSLTGFSNTVLSSHGRILRDGAFASRLDITKLSDLLKCSSAFDIYQLRGIFHELYKPGNIKDFLSGDRDAINALLKEMKSLESYEGFDRIQKMHIQKFSNELNSIFSRL